VKGGLVRTGAIVALWSIGAVILPSGLQPSASAAEIVQYFPAVPPGGAPPKAESGWRIKYEVLPSGSHGYGGSSVWEIQSVEFMRGYKLSGEEDWIKILNNLALAEMYVPYYDGYEIHDITDYGFSFVNATAGYIPSAGVISGRLLDDGVVIAEVADDHVRWMTSASDRIRRGQVLDLWATLAAGNYRYILKYSFADDGTIRVRAGGTAQNLRSVAVGNHNGMHIHMPAWRLEFDLGAASANSVEITERMAESDSAAADLVHRPFNGGVEGGEVWNPERFTSLMVSSKQFDNRHDPAHKIGYKLVSARSGSTRTHRDYVKYDFWVTRIAPAAANRSVDRELRFIDVATYVQNPEPINGYAVAIWHSTALHHIPRTEDFGSSGYRAHEGLALTMWTGFDMMPHNLWDKTPLFGP
jgi:hypothetical protein